MDSEITDRDRGKAKLVLEVLRYLNQSGIYTKKHFVTKYGLLSVWPNGAKWAHEFSHTEELPTHLAEYRLMQPALEGGMRGIAGRQLAERVIGEFTDGAGEDVIYHTPHGLLVIQYDEIDGYSWGFVQARMLPGDIYTEAVHDFIDAAMTDASWQEER